jgi:hypothetical protein
MRTETMRFVDDVFRSAGGRLTSLLSASHTFVNPTLAAFYGVPAPPGQDYARVDLDAGRRAGVLTHASVMAAHGGTGEIDVYRGHFVRERLLGGHLPPPPPDVDFSLPRMTSATCRPCHALMDPIGQGLLAYDRIGRWKAAEAARAGEIVDNFEGPVDVRGAFAGPIDLARKLAGSGTVARTIAGTLLRYALRRQPAEGESCEVERLQALLAEGDGDLGGLVTAIAESDLFRRTRR